MYSHGSSEEILGRALKDFADRDDVVIATKLRHPMRPGPNGKGLSRKAIMTEVEHSLRRLGTDYIDLYQIHRNDHATPLEETLEALHDLVKAGKVRYLGASSMHAWEFAKALHLQREHGWARFVSMQDHYNLLAREEEREMIPLCLRRGRRHHHLEPAGPRPPRPPLGRRQVDRAGRDRRRRTPTCSTRATTADSDRAIIDAVGQIAATRGVTRAQVALAWLRSKPVVTAPLVGASTARADRRRSRLAGPRAHRRGTHRAGGAVHAALRLPGRLGRGRDGAAAAADPRLRQHLTPARRRC